jgi:hypothetical protein
MSVKRSLASGLVVFFTSVDKRYIWNMYRSDVIWCIQFYFTDAGISTRKLNTGEDILQILPSVCPRSHYYVTKKKTKQINKNNKNNN